MFSLILGDGDSFGVESERERDFDGDLEGVRTAKTRDEAPILLLRAIAAASPGFWLHDSLLEASLSLSKASIAE